MRHGRLRKLLSPLLHATGRYRRQWSQPGFRDACVVLVYHRVAPEGGVGDPPGFGVECGVPVEVFEAQMRFMLRYFDPVRACDLVGWAGASPNGRPSFAVTFDDGYLDNLTHAAPVLQRLGIPATLFLSTDFVGTGRLFWWEQLGRMLRETREKELDLSSVPDLRRRGELPDHLPLGSRARRERAHWSLSMGLMKTPPHELLDTVIHLADALDVPLRLEGRANPMLTWNDVRRLRHFGFDIGAHGSGHVHLGLAGEDVVEAQIRASVERIAEELDEAPRLFAYPYGGPDHRTPFAERTVQDSGCEAAFTTETGAVRKDSPRFSLPRAGLTRRWGFVTAHHVQQALTART
jgi:peptidoglycan/xylan/chitin deacetylase (PgdA/CDA1 family)